MIGPSPPAADAQRVPIVTKDDLTNCEIGVRQFSHGLVNQVNYPEWVIPNRKRGSIGRKRHRGEWTMNCQREFLQLSQLQVGI